jgi:glycogen operon protein
VVIDDDFDWQGDRHLRRTLSETVIYEMHVRGFTRSRTSGAAHPGTYLGVIEKIPYLQSLGVTAVELMPVHEFPINNCWGEREERRNYWGYDPLCFFAPHRGYAASHEPGAQVREFKEMVRALHQAGIEVILDVVFNHTAEGNHLGPTLSFKGLANRIYYMLENDPQYYRNYSGCGNTVNGNHPIVREMIFLCLRHWVLNYHVDGFRFDLASILNRDRNGELVPNPPLVEAIAECRWRLPGGIVCQSPLGRMERTLSRRRAPLLAGRSLHGRGTRHAYFGLERPVSIERTASVSQYQLPDVARRFHAERPEQLPAQAQLRQRRRESRRRQ